jgi:hypothetical protein
VGRGEGPWRAGGGPGQRDRGGPGRRNQGGPGGETVAGRGRGTEAGREEGSRRAGRNDRGGLRDEGPRRAGGEGPRWARGTSLHCTGKVEDAGPTTTAAYYRRSGKWDISQKQRALYQ